MWILGKISCHNPQINNSLISLLVSIRGSVVPLRDMLYWSFVPFVDVVRG